MVVWPWPTWFRIIFLYRAQIFWHIELYLYSLHIEHISALGKLCKSCCSPIVCIFFNFLCFYQASCQICSRTRNDLKATVGFRSDPEVLYPVRHALYSIRKIFCTESRRKSIAFARRFHRLNMESDLQSWPSVYSCTLAGTSPSPPAAFGLIY